jgi:hypothetical protein
MCSHQINNNITSKQFFHLLVFLVDAPDARNAVIEHQKSRCFLGEDQKTLIYGTGGKIGACKAIQKRLEWEKLILFAD